MLMIAGTIIKVLGGNAPAAGGEIRWFEILENQAEQNFREGLLLRISFVELYFR